MNKLAKVWLLIYASWITFWYVCIAVITWSIDPGTWDIFRVVYALVGLIGGVFYSSLVTKYGEEKGLL